VTSVALAKRIVKDSQPTLMTQQTALATTA